MLYYEAHDGARIFYTDAGQGRPLLLLHSWSCDGNDWPWQAPELEKSYRVITVDHRGHGHGHGSAPHGSYRLQMLADDAAELLKEVAHGRAAVIFGHSMAPWWHRRWPSAALSLSTVWSSSARWTTPSTRHSGLRLRLCADQRRRPWPRRCSGSPSTPPRYRSSSRPGTAAGHSPRRITSSPTAFSGSTTETTVSAGPSSPRITCASVKSRASPYTPAKRQPGWKGRFPAEIWTKSMSWRAAISSTSRYQRNSMLWRSHGWTDCHGQPPRRSHRQSRRKYERRSRCPPQARTWSAGKQDAVHRTRRSGFSGKSTKTQNHARR